jgi:transcriptional antiterminator RfaH
MNQTRWVALYTRPRHEKQVAAQLSEKKIHHYLPLVRIQRQWSDRKKWVEEPLFRSYLFVLGDAMARYRAVQTYGTVGLVKFGDEAAVVRDEEIETIRRLLREGVTLESCEMPRCGDEVEIRQGPFSGFRGVLEEIQNGQRMVIRIPSIRQGIRFNVDMQDIRKISIANQGVKI